MMKKVLAIALSSIMILSSSMMVAAEEEPVNFSYSFMYMNEGTDYMADPVGQWVEENWNVDIDVKYISNDGHAETVRNWIYGGTMPDLTVIENFNKSEYQSFIDQGLIAPLPDGWETTYPNLYKMIEKTGLLEQLIYDGKVYGIPHAAYCNFLDLNPNFAGGVLWYRADWAKELGFDFAERETVTFDELNQYLTAVIEKDMSGTGTTYGVSCSDGTLYDMFMTSNAGIRYQDFRRDEDAQQYVWNPSANAEIIGEQIVTMRDWYKTGLIDPDFYLLEDNEARVKFASGLSGAFYGQTHVHGKLEMQNAFAAANEALNFDECVDNVILEAADGNAYMRQTMNFYTYSVMNPEISEETQARMLEIVDYFCTAEGQLVRNLGIEGEDWERDEDGNPTGGTNYPSVMAFDFMSIVSDDFSFSNPAYEKELRDSCLTVYDYFSTKGTIVPLPTEYEYHVSETKDMYSLDLDAKITELVMNEEDIAASWESFLGEYSGMVDPLLEELNATYFGA